MINLGWVVVDDARRAPAPDGDGWMQLPPWRLQAKPKPDGFVVCGAESLDFPQCWPAKCYAHVNHEHPHIACCDSHPSWRTDVIVRVQLSPRAKAAAREEG